MAIERYISLIRERHHMRTWRPEDDGITHINIYSQAKTLLGVLLSNWTPLPHNYPIRTDDGPFMSIEGYWAWLGYAQPSDYLRSVTGFAAKSLILDNRERNLPEEEFRRKITVALTYKCNNLGPHQEEFDSSTLPFAHYYVRNGKVRPARGGWMVDIIEDIRAKRQEDTHYDRRP